MDLGLDKKSLITLGVIAVVVIASIIAVFSMSMEDGKLSKIDTDLVVTVNGKDYMVDEFKKFEYLKNEADGDIAKQISGEEMEEMINTFVSNKLYVAAADSKKISVPSEEMETYRTEYANKKDTLSPYNINEADYLNYKKDEYKVNQLTQDFASYYSLPQDVYNEFISSISGEDLKSYSYRMMSFGYEVKEDSGESEETSGELNADVSGETTISGESAESGEEDKSKEAVSATVQDVLSRVKNGEDFEELAKEFADFRLTFKGSQYDFGYGKLEYAVGPLLQSKVGNDALYEAIKNTASGEYTDIIDDEENTTFYFARVESNEDGFVGEAESELKEILVSQYMDALIEQDVKYEVNTSGINKIYLTGGI